jgi:hypothetical protein
MKREDEIRERIKSILEKRRQPEERILDVHGSDEYGLDLILIKLDPFGKLRAYGVQVKTGDIKCSGRPTQRIKEIIGQIAIAYGKTVWDGEKYYRLDGFYIITDGKISEKAKGYIESAILIRNLHFIDKDSLDEFIKKYGDEIFKES